jgi:hypothetical protein
MQSAVHADQDGVLAVEKAVIPKESGGRRRARSGRLSDGRVDALRDEVRSVGQAEHRTPVETRSAGHDEDSASIETRSVSRAEGSDRVRERSAARKRSFAARRTDAAHRNRHCAVGEIRGAPCDGDVPLPRSTLRPRQFTVSGVIASWIR